MAFHRTFLGHGVGLRTDHFPQVTAGAARGRVDFFEVISENFMVPGGRPLAVLEQVRRDFPVLLHGVSLSIGASDRLNIPYLKKLRELADRFSPAWVSDHLCWGSAGGNYAHDLLPLPFSEEALALVVARVGRVQDLLGRQILLENVSSYLTFRGPQLSEWEFLAAVAERADCGILLDVNNIYVSSVNHGFDPLHYLEAIPAGRVQQIHLAGHSDHGDYIVDTHDHPIVDPVWNLYAAAVRRFGSVATMIERDDNIPPLAELTAELDVARGIAHKQLQEAA